MRRPVLVRRGRIWSVRLSLLGVPLWKSLRTSSQEQAVLRSNYLQAVATATTFESNHLPTEGQIKMVKSKLSAIVRQWVDEELERQEAIIADSGSHSPEDIEDYADIHSDLVQEAVEDLQGNLLRKVEPLATSLASRFNIPPADFNRLCRELLKGKVELAQEAAARNQGLYPGEPLVGATLGVEAAVVPVPIQASAVRVASTPLICKGDVVRWKGSLMARISPGSVAKALVHLGHYCRWLKTHDYLATDPTDGLLPSARNQRLGKVKKLDFSREQLRAMVDNLVDRRQTPDTLHFEEYFWIVLLCLYGGFRNSEARYL